MARARGPDPEAKLPSSRLIDTIRGRLLPEAPEPSLGRIPEPDWRPEVPHERPPVPAAVLIALIEREAGLSVLYTERATGLRAHSGQIAFPGGKIDGADAGPGAAAIREAGEEVGLNPGEADILGYLPLYFTGTNYLITPVVARVRPGVHFVPNPDEVAELFEVPLADLMDPGRYGTHVVRRNGVEHRTWRIEHERFLIWGITANLTRVFYEQALCAGGADADA